MRTNKMTLGTDPDEYRSIYFDYQHHPVTTPPELRGENPRHKVAIVGAGPVGMVLALALVQRGIPVVLLEDETTVNRGSRAAGTSRRSLEILQTLGAAERIAAKGVSWTGGQSYYRDRPVLAFEMPASEGDQFPPMVNLQQCFVEQYILDELEKSPLAEIRWGSVVAGVEPLAEGARIEVSSGGGSYHLDADWVVACDGARSVVRSALGLRLEGQSFESRYVIADVRLDTDLPPGRRVWFDSACYPGSTVILHRQADDIWRIDYQLRPEDDADLETQPETVKQRIQHFLDAVGIAGNWTLDWVSLYRAHSLSLEQYRHGHVIFAGDAAHLVPIFGARGMNSGIDDAFNLAWKLAYVIDGQSEQSLLDSYSLERHFAFQENIRNANKSAAVMSPPTRGDAVLRDAVLSLALTEPDFRPLLNPRQSSDIALTGSPLNLTGDSSPSGPVVGAVLPNLPAGSGYLQELLGRDFTLICCAAPAAELAALATTEPSLRLVQLGGTGELGVPDPDGSLARRLGLTAGAGLLIRPDQHIAGRWRNVRAETVSQGLAAVSRKPEQEIIA